MTQDELQFIETLFRSLEREMHKGFADLGSRIDAVQSEVVQMNHRFDRIGGLVNGGGRALTRLMEWSERTDVTTADVLRRMTELESRVRKLENGHTQ